MERNGINYQNQFEKQCLQDHAGLRCKSVGYDPKMGHRSVLKMLCSGKGTK